MNYTTHTPSHLIDVARPLRRLLIESSDPVAQLTHRPGEHEIRIRRMEAKLGAAKTYLGSRWILHPAYQFNPRHSFHIAIWQTSRGVLDEIRVRAVLAGRL